MEDVNATTNIALCRACGQVSGVDEVLVSDAFMEKQPHFSLEHDAVNGSMLVYGRIFFRGFILLIAAVALNALLAYIGLFSIMGNFVAGIVAGREALPLLLGLLLCLLPVCAGLAGLWFGLLLLFGKLVLKVNGGQGTVFRGIGSLGLTRRFALVREAPAHVVQASSSRNGGEQWLVAVPQTKGRAVRFGWGNSDADAAAGICAWLNRQAAGD